MMYWILLVTLSLSVSVLLHSLAVVMVGTVLRVAAHRLERMRPKRAVNVLLGLRGFPFAASGLIVLGIVVPAFLRHEPEGGEEHLSFKLIVLTTIAATLVVHSVGRSLHLLLRTRRLTREWQRSAEKLAVKDAPLPVFRFVHEHPQMAVVGLLRPRLFVSSGAFALLDADELDAAFAHEAAHYRAGDLWKQLMMRALPDLLPGTRSLTLAESRRSGG
jgi:Zn-dependent protease with chaperone function